MGQRQAEDVFERASAVTVTVCICEQFGSDGGAGSAVVLCVAQRLRRVARRIDSVCRFLCKRIRMNSDALHPDLVAFGGSVLCIDWDLLY